MFDVERIDDCRIRIPKQGKMRVEGIVYVDEILYKGIKDDMCLQQVANVATLPGILKASLAMPDIHWGYGFPIGGVAAFDLDNGIVSPGGVGYDINCGVRLLKSHLSLDQVKPELKNLVNHLYQKIPSGVGSSGLHPPLSESDYKKLFVQGAEWAVGCGFGQKEDLKHLEAEGALPGADPDGVSARAKKRGADQLGTLGSGNHFLEIDFVSQIFDEEKAAFLGLFPNQICVTIHCGSRGVGHQTCDDHLGIMLQASKKYGIDLPDPQLCCAPIGSEEGRRYLSAMAAVANFAFANRQVIAHQVRKVFGHLLKMNDKDLGMEVVYDVCHNIAKFENHRVSESPRTCLPGLRPGFFRGDSPSPEGVEGEAPSGFAGGEGDASPYNREEKKVLVHRKGATRAFPPGHPETPEAYQKSGQPVLIPGDMGRYSYVLVGTGQAFDEVFGSSCHGAGRVMSRNKALKSIQGRPIIKELEEQGIIIKADSFRTIGEEIPEAYKDVAHVVEVVEKGGLARIVAQLKPLGVVKG